MGKKFLALFILTLLIAPIVFSAGPCTHGRLLRIALDESPDSPTKQIMVQNKDHAAGGSLLNDLGVFGYFSEGISKIGTSYKATHNGGFVQCILRNADRPEELAIGHGAAAHLLVDSEYHNGFVPRQIKTTNLPNAFIHGPAELTIDSECQAKNPQDLEDVKAGLKTILEDEEAIELIQGCLLTSGGKAIDVEEKIALLLGTLGEGSFFASVWGLSALYVPLAQGNATAGVLFLIFGGTFVAWGLFTFKDKNKKGKFSRIRGTIQKLGPVKTSIVTFIVFLALQIFFVLSFFGSTPELMFILTSISLTIWLVLMSFTRGGRLTLGTTFLLLGSIMALGGVSIFVSDNAAQAENDRAVANIKSYIDGSGSQLIQGLDATGFESIQEANNQVYTYSLIILAAFILTSVIVFIVTARGGG